MFCEIRKFASFIFVASFFLVLCSRGFSQSDSEDSESSSTEDFFDDSSLGDLFNSAEDSDNPIVTGQNDSGSDTTLNIASLSIPLKMSGDMSAEIGGAYINDNKDSDFSAYFDFYNYLYFTARPDKYMAIKGSFKTALPSDGDEETQNHYFYLYELYFDYIMADKIYITAGKKNTVWGNIRLFSNDDNFDDDDRDALYTNVLYDSRENISGILRIPFGPSTLNFLIMYGGGAVDDGIERKDMSYAASLDFVLFKTSINFFGRMFPSENGNQAASYQPPILGAEVKRTIFGIDFYIQSLARVKSNSTLKKVFKEEFYDKKNFSKFVFTGGFYRIFDSFYPNFGINAEFQGIYYPADTYKYENEYYTDKSDFSEYLSSDDNINKYLIIDKGTFTKRFIVDIGLSKIGPDRNIKLGVQWNHDITNKSGYVKPALIISNITPHCDLRTGFKWEYWEEQEYFGKITFGTYLKFSLGY